MKNAVVLFCALAAAPGLIHAEDVKTYPVVIVGSGYGGSIAAYNLAICNGVAVMLPCPTVRYRNSSSERSCSSSGS